MQPSQQIIEDTTQYAVVVIQATTDNRMHQWFPPLEMIGAAAVDEAERRTIGIMMQRDRPC